MRVLFYGVLLDFQNSVAFWKVLQALPIYLSGNSNMWMGMSVGHWWYDIDRGETEVPWEKPAPLSLCPQVSHGL